MGCSEKREWKNSSDGLLASFASSEDVLKNVFAKNSRDGALLKKKALGQFLEIF